ncbi:hypothetical protein ACFPVX_22880 [Cohnella faecalis]|uniref:Uncharacterized protein n=1 Tax=Cohnella faecalis TaxID=2315694 RepID=A0A398CTZ5_9BACL|nr:hypothetical protein [Cohnella faecalis]RIE02434.1 hypothetical protein D3H35_17165 [Cohnella faecalis]
MSIQQDLIFRMLPSQFRKSDESSLIYQLCWALGFPLGGLDRLGRRVLKSRYLDSVSDIADAARLALPFGEPPWPQDTIDEYRERLQSYIPLFLQGALSAERIILLTALAYGGTADTIALPNPYNLPDRPANEANVTTGRITAVVRDGSGKPSVVAFTAAVIERPEQARQQYTVAPTAEQSTWVIDGDGSFSPVIDITAGANPLVAPILAQRDTGFLLLVNRIIPPGGTIRIDTAASAVRDFGGSPSSDGPVLMPDGTAPPLLCGTGAILDDERSNKLSESDGTPLRLVHWSAAKIESAPLLPKGTSSWRLLQVARSNAESLAADVAPNAAEKGILVADLTTSFPDPAGCPKSVTFRWDIAPIPASFTVAYRADHQSSWYPEAPLAPNVSWLRNQINRLKPAGVAYLDPASVIL